MTPVRIAAVSLASLLIALPGVAAEKPKDQETWIQLFNGKDLTGWKIKITGHELGDNYGNTFRVEDGVLKVAYDKYEKFNGKFGHLFYHEPFSNYRLQEGRAGHSATAAS